MHRLAKARPRIGVDKSRCATRSRRSSRTRTVGGAFRSLAKPIELRIYANFASPATFHSPESRSSVIAEVQCIFY